MQTCSLCQTQSPDDAILCITCQSDLREFSVSVVTLKKFQENPRVSAIHIAASADACPVCQSMVGTYPKDKVPRLPIVGCSHEHGCSCVYQPLLTEIYP